MLGKLAKRLRSAIRSLRKSERAGKQELQQAAQEDKPTPRPISEGRSVVIPLPLPTELAASSSSADEEQVPTATDEGRKYSRERIFFLKPHFNDGGGRNTGLDDETYHVVRLKLEGAKPDEIAQKLYQGGSPSSARVRIHRKFHAGLNQIIAAITQFAPKRTGETVPTKQIGPELPVVDPLPVSMVDSQPNPTPPTTLPRTVEKHVSKRGLDSEEEPTEEVVDDEGRVRQAERELRREEEEAASPSWTKPPVSIPQQLRRFRFKARVRLPNYRHPWKDPTVGRLAPEDLYLLWESCAKGKEPYQIAQESYIENPEIVAPWICTITKRGIQIILATEFNEANYPGTASALRAAVIRADGGDGQKVVPETPRTQLRPNGEYTASSATQLCPKCGTGMRIEEDWAAGFYFVYYNCLSCGCTKEISSEPIATPEQDREEINREYRQRRRQPSHGKIRL